MDLLFPAAALERDVVGCFARKAHASGEAFD